MPLDPDRLNELAERCSREPADGILPSAQVAVGLDGEIAWARTFGQADDASQYAVFSCTKAFVAAVCWQLFAEGSLDPDAPVATYWPEFGANGKGSVTVGQLLSHTSGFPRAPLGQRMWGTRESRRAAMEGWRCTWEPGSQFEYHPTAAHWVLGELVHMVDGCSLGDAARARLFEPLGMTSTFIGVPVDRQDGIVHLSDVGEFPTPEEIRQVFGVDTYDLGEVTPEALLAFNDPEVRAIGVPGGGGVSTAVDLARFYQALLHDPGGIFDPSWLARGTGDVINMFPDPVLTQPASRTLGLIVANDDGRAFMRGMGHTVGPRAFGHNGAAGQIAWADPDSGLSFVYLTNGIDRNFLRESRRVSGIASRAGLLTTPR